MPVSALAARKPGRCRLVASALAGVVVGAMNFKQLAKVAGVALVVYVAAEAYRARQAG